MRLIKRTMLIIIAIIFVLAGSVLLYMNLPKFGKAPSGKRLERIKQSPNYSEGAFVNKTFTPSVTEGHSFFGVLSDFMFRRNAQLRPQESIPSVKTDLHQLPADSDLLVWFGHSSYYMQVDGVKFLIDPVFSGNVSPSPASVSAFKGTNIYSVDDMPAVDYLLITHDHYDHLDYKTVKELKGKVKYVICGLGVGSHLEHWGYPADRIIEKDWDESLDLGNGMTIHTLTARHFSGRTFKRNNTLWLSFLLETPTRKFFLGGDGAYDDHFAEIGERFGPIDLAILENGQYNIAWHAIHCLPEETLKAAKELRAARMMPVHSSKFALAFHAWDEPLSEVSRLNQKYQIPLVTPMIGELVNLNDTTQTFTEWWKKVP